MLFSRRLSSAVLVAWCRTARMGLQAGLLLPTVFRNLATNGPLAGRAVAERLADRMAAGESLEDALRPEEGYFPPLFLDLLEVGEQSGRLVDVFIQLEDYFDLQRRLRRQFISQITWPAFQFVMAVGVLTLLILVLGLIAEANPGSAPFDPLGLGLLGPSGAAIFLGSIVGILAGLVATYLVAARLLKQKAFVDGLLLKLPAIGTTLEAFAVGRFAIALGMTLGTGLSVPSAVRRSFRATGNAAFQAAADRAVKTVKRGGELRQALRGGPFPEEFLQVVEVAEESGSVPETMQQQAAAYHEEAARRLSALTQVAGFLVWALVAILITVAIFRIFGRYVAALGV